MWRGASATRYHFTPFDLSPQELPANLESRLRVTEGVIIDWYFQRIPAVVLLEELHTACELLLQHLVNRRAKRMSFAELVAEAEDKDLFPAGNLGGPAIGGQRLLIELKDYRKNARHRATGSFEPWVKHNWENVALLIEHLAKSPLPA